MRPQPLTPRRAIARFALGLILGLAAAPVAFAGFAGFERRGFPPERPNGIQPVEARPPRLKAHRVDGHPVRIDGRLDEPAWHRAEAAHGFLKWHPDRGLTPSEETIFKVAYDDHAIYFGVACLENDSRNIASSLSRRDQIRDSDVVSIYIDPYHDKDTGYNFRVNPAGVQEDAYLFDNGDRDSDWNAVWAAETFRDDDGWYAEVRIPFSSIRYRPQESMTWGLQLYRYMQRRGEDTAWVVWDQEASGFVSRFGELTDIRGVKAPRRLELLPYFVQSTTDPSLEGPDDELENRPNVGLDLKYGVTPDLTLNATFQPDFGQVEADPTVVNRSPFETRFDEKRPFFIEGSRFFDHRSFDLFYSRRVGLDEEDSRIRFAGKLTGKAAGNVSLAGLYAATDVTERGQAHNFLKNGEHATHYLVGRLGKDFADGNHQVHVMQTAVLRTQERETPDDDGRAFRNGYTTGADFDLRFRDRTYAVGGSFVGSLVDPAEVKGDPSIDHSPFSGTGGQLVLAKYGGRIRSEMWGRWEHNRLDLNDMGFLSAPDDVQSGLWVGWRYIPPDKSPRLNEANLNLNLSKSWLYAGRREILEETGELLWDYSAGHPQNAGGNINGYAQLRNYWGAFFGVIYNAESTNRFITRGGPLMRRPAERGGWLGFHTDWRKPLNFEAEYEYYGDEAGGHYWELDPEVTWNATNRMSHAAKFQVSSLHEKAEYLTTVEHDGDASLGIGGESFVFGDLEEKTVELELRSNFLFSRNQSLEIYVAPFLSRGDFSNARTLRTPNSYDLVSYPEAGLVDDSEQDTDDDEDTVSDDLRVDDFDDLTASVNVNMVYRWEYRPGSTLFLVWTHGRSRAESRADNSALDHGLSVRNLFENEPENVFLAKLTYWFSL